MQSDSALPQVSSSESAPEVKLPRKSTSRIILLVLLVLGVAGLGYWNFQSNANLRAAQQSLAATQRKYDEVTARNENNTRDLGQTNGELEQVNAELVKTNENLTTARAELSKANSRVSGLKSKKEIVGPYVTLLFSVFFLPDNEAKGLTIYVLISLMKDQKLLDLYSNFTENPNQSNFETWIGYALTTMRDILRK